MTVKTIAKVKPAFPFEAYSHVCIIDVTYV